MTRRFAAVLVIVCLGLIGLGVSMPEVAPHPASAPAWMYQATPVPPVGLVH